MSKCSECLCAWCGPPSPSPAMCHPSHLNKMAIFIMICSNSNSAFEWMVILLTSRFVYRVSLSVLWQCSATVVAACLLLHHHGHILQTRTPPFGISERFPDNTMEIKGYRGCRKGLIRWHCGTASIDTIGTFDPRPAPRNQGFLG